MLCRRREALVSHLNGRRRVSAQRTTMVPRNMFMPQAKAISPGFCGVNSTATGRLSGSSFLIFSDGKVTDVAQLFSLVRVKVNLAGTPVRNTSRDGSKAASDTVT
jgi:hypothetical protein